MSTYIRVEQQGGEDWDRKLRASAFGIAGGVTVALNRAVKVSEGQLNAAVASMTGGDQRISNFPREGNNRHASARGGVRSTGNGIGQAAIGPKGPVVIVENDTSPHLIGFGRRSKAKSAIIGFTNTDRSGRSGNIYSAYSASKVTKAYGGKSSSRKRLKIGDKWVTGPVRHPGTSGKGIWKHTRDGPLRAALPKVMRLPVVRGAMRPWGR